MKNIDELFNNMDTWRHLPAYQLERRADIFFSIYLPDLLREKFQVDAAQIIPEFPIRVGTVYPKADVNKSFKVDYLVKVKNSPKVIFLELKTDDGSRRDQQDWYLAQAQQVGMTRLLDGLLQIYRATASKKKYRFLLNQLREMDFLSLDERGGYIVPGVDYEIQLVYLQPNEAGDGENVITFREASEIIRKNGDPLSLRFSESLLRWAEVKAGEAGSTR